MSGFPSPENAELLSAKYNSANARDSLFSRIVDSILVDTIENLSSEDYWFVLNQYQVFKHDPNWLNRSQPKDSIYQAWFEKVDQSTIGSLINIWKEMQVEPTDSLQLAEISASLGSDSLVWGYLDSLNSMKLSSAKSKLERISPRHPFDIYLKSTFNIYSEYWAKGDYALSPSDSASLYAKAISNELDAGPACLLARMMLELEVFESSGVARLSENDQSTIENTQEVFTLFPNPGHGSYTILSTLDLKGYNVLINIYSIDGRLVVQKQINLGETFNFIASSGLYLLDVVDQSNGLTLFKSKLLHQQN